MDCASLEGFKGQKLVKKKSLFRGKNINVLIVFLRKEKVFMFSGERFGIV